MGVDLSHFLEIKKLYGQINPIGFGSAHHTSLFKYLQASPQRSQSGNPSLSLSDFGDIATVPLWALCYLPVHLQGQVPAPSPPLWHQVSFVPFVAHSGCTVLWVHTSPSIYETFWCRSHSTFSRQLFHISNLLTASLHTVSAQYLWGEAPKRPICSEETGNEVSGTTY